MKYRAGVDTNVLFSGLFFEGPPCVILRKARKDELELVLSEYGVSELRTVLRRRERPEQSLNDLLALPSVSLVIEAHAATPERIANAKALCRDPKDVPLLTFALYALQYGLIDYFITGDADLLTPQIVKATHGRVVTPAAFLKLP